MSDSDIAKAAEIIGKRNLSLSKLATEDVSDTKPAPEKKRRGRPPKPNDRLDFDETMPLADDRVEEMLMSIVAGEHNHLAYKIAFKTAATKRSCTQQASKLLRRPDVSKRLSLLMQKKHTVDKQAMEEAEDALRDGLSLEGKIKAVERLLLKSGVMSASDAARLYILHGQLVDKRDASSSSKLQDMDPTAVCEYFRKAGVQGIDVAAIAAASETDDGSDTERPESDSEDNSSASDGGGAQDVVVSTDEGSKSVGHATHAAEFTKKNEGN